MHDVLYQPFPMEGAARAQIWRYAPQYRRPRHFHLEPELNLVTAGTGKFGVGETEISVTAGDLLWWTPGQDHELLEASVDFDLFVVALTPELSVRVLGDGSASIANRPRIRLAQDTLSRFAALCAAPMSGQEISVIERHVGDLWTEAFALRAPAPNLHTLTRRALTTLLGRPDLGREDVAQMVRGSPSEISRYFHRDMGLTLTAYRTRLRLLHFVRAMDEGAENLALAALGAGFGSYSQFHRAFVQMFGCSPRAFFATSARNDMEAAFSPWTAAELQRPSRAAREILQ